jgi:hypothetical protein
LKNQNKEKGGFVMAMKKISKTKFLKIFYGNKSFILDPLDSVETLANATDVFASINSALKKYKGVATNEDRVAVYELVKNATFSQIFSSLSNNLNNLCLTQGQIIDFVKKYRKWLYRTNSYVTYFLSKSDNNFFVVSIVLRSGDWVEVDVYRFEDSTIWCATDRRRLVIPQLA